MKNIQVERRVRQLAEDGKTADAVDLIEKELSATKTLRRSGAKAINVPDHRRRVAAALLALKIIKKHG